MKTQNSLRSLLPRFARAPRSMAVMTLIGAAVFCTTHAFSATATYKDGASTPVVGGTYTGTEDTFLLSNLGGSQNDNVGARGSIEIGGGSGFPRNGLIRFDITSLNGQFSSINSVTLRFYVDFVDTGGNTLQVFRLSNANSGWVEGTACCADGSTDSGMSTWDQRVQGSANWASGFGTGAGVAGTDYNSTMIGSAFFSGGLAAGTAVDITLTDATMISDWVSGNNSGLFLRVATDPGARLVLRSAESSPTSFPVGDTAHTPELIINYNELDTTPPSITCPPAATVQCDADVPAADFAGGSASDNSGSAPTVTHVSDMATGSCPKTITRTYRATDGSGNTNDCAQTITVNDTTTPMISCPADTSVQCFGNVPAPDLDTVIASDLCGAVVKSHVSDAYATNGCIITVTRTYKATDTCMNMSTCEQIITVSDTMAPTITCPPGGTFQCDADVPGPSFVAGTVSDNCDPNPVVTHVGDSSSGSCPKTVTRTWRATDACGNTNDCVQVFIVHDTTPPGITCPDDILVTTANPAGENVTFSPSATDNCGPLAVSCMPASGSLFAPGTTIVTCTATDSCNTNACTFTVTVNRHPVAVNNGLATTENRAASVFKFKLLGNDSDPDGDPILITSVSATSTNGGSVTMTSTRVIYTPQPGFIGNDRFSYTISDGRGGTATADVEVFVASGRLPSANQLQLTAVPGGFRVRFAGIPGFTYEIQRSPDLSDWTTIATVVAPAHGIIEYFDMTALPMAFYRTFAP